MNEQIREILSQCQLESIDGPEYPRWTDLEKFAELIVKECRAIAIQRLAIGTDKYTASHNGALWGVINEIDKHFGVEE